MILLIKLLPGAAQKPRYGRMLHQIGENRNDNITEDDS